MKSSTAKLPLHRMAIFSPGRQNDDEIRASYIARQAMLDLILEDIQGTSLNGIPQHHIIIGQRGMGKTTLLKRLDVALRTEPLAKRFIPLGFPEEQYSVDRLSTVFLNCLDSLADTLEREEDSQELIDRIDAEVERLRKDSVADEIVAQDAEKTLLKLAAETGRRPVLLMDNLDLIFDRLEKPELFHLRSFLMKAGAPILIGAAIHPPEDTQNYDSPFYDHFKPHHLTRLSLEEMREVLLKMAEYAGNSEIPARIDLERGRLHALHALTGGNPRTTRILFEIFAHGFSQEAYQDLEALLDWMTPIYKARFEEFSDQAQVVVSAIATIWEPAVISRICAGTRLRLNQVSPQLDRLKKSGVVEEVTVDPPERVGPIPSKRTPKDRTGYQLSERFFNIWFLMRQATRRDKRNLTFLTRFIECLHSPEERLDMAKELLSKSGLSRADQVYGLALEPTLANSSLQADLRDHIYEAIVQAKREFNDCIEEIIDPTEIPQRQWAIAELRERIIDNAPGKTLVAKRKFADEILACPMLVEQRASIASKRLPAKSAASLIKRVRAFRKSATKQWGEDDWKWFEKLLTTGALTDFSDELQVSAAIDRSGIAKRCMLVVGFASEVTLSLISESAWIQVERQMKPASSIRSLHRWLNWANILHRFGRLAAAEQIYLKILVGTPDDEMTLLAFGLLLHDLQRHSDACETFRRCVELNPENWAARFNLGTVLWRELKLHIEAEDVFLEGLKKHPDNVEILIGLGCVQYLHLDKADLALKAFEKALQIAPENAMAWNNLANVEHRENHDLAKAEEYYRKSIELNPSYLLASKNLSELLVEQGRFEDAQLIYQFALNLHPNDSSLWKSYGVLLRDHIKEYAEAEKAFREFLRINPEDSSMWNTLGNLLQDYRSDPEGAKEAYERSIALEPEDSICARCNQVFLLANHLNNISAATSMLSAINETDDHAGIEDGVALASSVISAQRENWGDAADHLKKALAVLGETKSFPSRTIDDWMRTSAAMIHLGFGQNLLLLLEETGFNLRLRPWTEAIKAILRGDKKYLRNSAMEVRDSAAELFDEIKVRLAGLPKISRKWSQPKVPR